jgi:hypothetical protein
MLAPLADTFNIYLASPSANRSCPWWSPLGMSRILQTIRYMTLHYPVNPDKIFLAGVSDGATACYLAANTIPGPFAGFFSVSGYGGMLIQAGLTLYPANIMQRPIYNINAGKDRLYPIDSVNKFLDNMQSAGVNITRKVYPDELHGFDYKAKEWGTFANFIRTWKKPFYTSVSWTCTPGYPNVTDNLLTWTDNNEYPPSINGFWQSDTLRVQATNLQSALVVKPSSIAKAHDAWLSYKGKITRIKPDNNTGNVFMKMQNSLFPSADSSDVYSVKF